MPKQQKSDDVEKDTKDTTTTEPLVNPDDICFVVSPIGPDNSEIRRDANRALNGIIKQGAELAGFKRKNVVRADEITKSGAIDDYVIDYLHKSKVVVADLTTVNPNVMFELALRYSFGKPVIHIKNIACEKRIPFDIITQKTIFYSLDDTDQIDTYRATIAEHIVECLESHDDEKPNNPVYKAIAYKFKLPEITKENKDSDQALMISMFNELSSKIDQISSSPQSPLNPFEPKVKKVSSEKNSLQNLSEYLNASEKETTEAMWPFFSKYPDLDYHSGVDGKENIIGGYLANHFKKDVISSEVIKSFWDFLKVTYTVFSIQNEINRMFQNKNF